MPALEMSLKELQMEYVDMFLIHCPMSMPPGETDFPTDEHGELVFEDERTDITDTWRVGTVIHTFLYTMSDRAPQTNKFRTDS